jgi:outer membrane protein OmpA-like peptidoglycan-associated protein
MKARQRRLRALLPAAAALAVAALAACAGSTVRSDVAETQRRIATARDHGAMRCAPVELAKAEAHADFAREDLSEGNYFEAKRQAQLAREQADAAIEKSPKERCVPAQVPKIGDRDGDGLKDDVDECKDDPEDKDQFQDDDGCPDPDNDGDGVVDGKDKCPLEPEDKDNFQDDDGCPELDNDGDELPDTSDTCPDAAEDKDGFEDADGCPDCDDDRDGVPECPEAKDKCPGQHGEPEDGCPKKYDLVVVTESKIELKQTVFFDTRKATIKPVSFPLLDDVAKALADHPKISVRIEGHTDSQGSDKFNLALSQRRAESVRAYLIGKGIEQDRMVAKGFGERAPIADNRTSDGRAQNRRVEFVITAR